MDEAVARWKALNPYPISIMVNDETRDCTPEEYEEMAVTSVPALLDMEKLGVGPPRLSIAAEDGS